MLYLGIGAYFPCRIWTTKALRFTAWNGCLRQHNSYKIHPAAHMSDLWLYLNGMNSLYRIVSSMLWQDRLAGFQV